MTSFEKMVELDVFHRYLKKCFSLLRTFLHGWRKVEIICDKLYRKEKCKTQQDNLALFRRKHGLAHKEGKEKELEN